MKTGQKKIAAAAAILWLILATSPVQITNGAAFAEENLRNSLEDISISNFSRVTPDIWRGSNPDDDELEMLHLMGVKSIINLRMSGPGVEHEKAISARLGIKHFHIPFGYFKTSDKKIEEALSIMTKRENQPVYIHCLQGADRTGMIIGVYRSLIQDWSFNKTYSEMRSHHFKPWFGRFRSKVKHCAESKPLVAARDEIIEEKKVNQARSSRIASSSNFSDLSL